MLLSMKECTCHIGTDMLQKWLPTWLLKRLDQNVSKLSLDQNVNTFSLD